MMKKIFLLFVFAISTTQITGCSLFSSDEETETAAVSEDGKDSESETPSETVEGGDALDTEITADSNTSSATTSDSATGADEYPDDDYDNPSNVAVSESPSTAETESLLVDEGGGKEEAPMFDSGSSETQTAASDDLPSEPVQEEKPQKYTSFESTGSSGLSPVKKMETSAFTRGGANLNRLYVARPGDSMKEVSQKIFGEDKSSQLFKWNPSLQGRSLKVGDKIYYSSAANPSDSKMMLYYEEAGVTPTFFNLKKGQNFRKVSKELLGHDRSWMEIWATNMNLESKWEVTADDQIKYWPANTTAAPIAKEETAEPPPAATEQSSPEVEEIADVSEPQPSEGADVSEPAEAAAPEVAEVEEVENTDDFSPPPAQANTAPPPPPPAAGTPPPMGNSLTEEDPSMSTTGQDDTMMQVAMGVLVILLGLILLIMVRRNRAKAKKVKLSQTQV